MIRLTLYWWMLPAALIAAPFVYVYFRAPHGDWDFGIDVMLWFTFCWAIAGGIVLGKIF